MTMIHPGPSHFSAIHSAPPSPCHLPSNAGVGSSCCSPESKKQTCCARKRYVSLSNRWEEQIIRKLYARQYIPSMPYLPEPSQKDASSCCGMPHTRCLHFV